MKTAWTPMGRGALIILLTIVVYGPTMRDGFVFDDSLLIAGNPIIQASKGLSRLWFTTKPKEIWPLTTSLWWLEWRLWGASPMGYHVVNVLFHAVNAVLVWLILRRLKIPGAWVAALVFAVHPVNVATVAWVSEQKNTLSMFFYALAVLLYLRFDEQARAFAAKSWGWYVLSLLAFLMALLSKTAVVMLPVVLLGCVWWRHGRVRWKDFLYSAPFFAFSLILGLVTIWFQHHRALGESAVRTSGIASRLAAAGWVPWFYLSKALLPINLTVVYPKWGINVSQWVSYAPGMLLAGCFTLAWWKRRTWGRPLLFGLGYFVVTLFPVSGFFDQGFYQFSLVADHWQYHAIIGVVALVVAAGERIHRQMGEQEQSWKTIAGVVVLILLAAGTWRRSSVYKNDETLWRDNVAKNSSAWLAHDNLGTALWQAGKIQEAMAHFEQALRIKPDYAETHDNLGAALWQAGRVQEAMEHWEQALQIKPNDSKAHSSLGLALVGQGKLREAAEHWEQALRIKPNDARTHYNLGVALEQTGRTQEAIRHYELALQIKPDYAEARNKLARLRAVP
jgi:tetratricopeptide (TPR) repeat protein